MFPQKISIPPAQQNDPTGANGCHKTDWAEPMRTLSMASHSTFLGLLGLVLHGHRLDVVPLAGVWERHGMRQLYDSKKTKKEGETVGSLSIDSILDGLLCCLWYVYTYVHDILCIYITCKFRYWPVHLFGSPIIFNIAAFKSCQWHHFSEQSVLVETDPCWKGSCWDSLLSVFEWLLVQHGIVAIINIGAGVGVVSNLEKLNFRSAIRHVTGGPWTRIPILLESCNLPNEQWKNTGCLGYSRDFTTHLCGIVINH